MQKTGSMNFGLWNDAVLSKKGVADVCFSIRIFTSN